MKTLLLLLAAVFSVEATWESGLSAHFALGIPGLQWAYSIPETKTEAVSAGWVEMAQPEGAPMAELLTMHCYNPDFCAHYDDNGYVSGIQASLKKSELSNITYDMKTQGWTNWTATYNNVTEEYVSISAYFCSPETLAMSAESRQAVRAEYNKTLQHGFLLVTGFNQELVYIGENATTNLTSSDSKFTEQACIIWMGHHYYFNMTKNTVCSASTIFSWFPLSYANQLIGIGLNAFATRTLSDDRRNWFESPSSSTVEMIVPNGPQCLYDLADSPGIITLHIYFIKNPHLITCVFE